MKIEELRIKDVVKFKTLLLGKKVEDIGIIKDFSFDEEWKEMYVEIIPFNLKISTKLLKPSEVKKKIGEYSNFDFTNDFSNHDHPEEYEFVLRLSDEFYKRYIEEIGYAYWNTAEEMKKSFDGLDKIKCIAYHYWGPHMYHVTTSVHDLRLTDKFIKGFSI